MKVIVGSKNPTKVNAVKAVFPEDSVIAVSVPSNVSAQPTSDRETRKGAIQRALACVRDHHADIGIGLEGGVMFLDEELYLCNWGALVTEDEKVFTASGDRIKLPDEFIAPIQKGVELSDIIDDYTTKKDVRSHEGTIGIFTNNQVTRQALFQHIMLLLKGQWEYWKQHL